MDEKIYALMAQAEELQAHAKELQFKAQESFKSFPLAVTAASKELRRRGIIHGLLVLTFGVIVSVIASAAIYWTTSNLRAERADLLQTVAELEQTAQDLKSDTWSLELVIYRENNNKGIILPKNMVFEWSATLKDGRTALVVK